MGPGSTIASIPVLGQYFGDATTSYAMYKLLEENDGSDFISILRQRKSNNALF